MNIVNFELIVGFAGLLYYGAGWIDGILSELSYRKERRKFDSEIKNGKTPDWVPIRVNNEGALSIEPEDLFRTKQFKDQIEAAGRLERLANRKRRNT